LLPRTVWFRVARQKFARRVGFILQRSFLMKTANPFAADALRWSVSVALGVTMATTSGIAFAQDDDNDEDLSGRVEVTGSRIKRADIEGALPVTVIDRNQIELSGETSVADLLRNTTFNSFGSFRPASGSSAQSW